MDSSFDKILLLIHVIVCSFECIQIFLSICARRVELLEMLIAHLANQFLRLVLHLVQT